jgi:hypothetical protein
MSAIAAFTIDTERVMGGVERVVIALGVDVAAVGRAVAVPGRIVLAGAALDAPARMPRAGGPVLRADWPGHEGTAHRVAGGG